MDFKQLQHFIRIAELGSFSRAANALTIAQPALSRQIRLLEVELGANLFVRHGRGVRLTEQGARLIDHARGILYQCERTAELVRDDMGALAATVAVGLPPSLCKLLAVPLLSDLRTRHPRLRVQIREGLSVNLREWVGEGSLDCAVVYNAESSPDFDAERIGIEPRYVVSAKHKRPKARRVAPEALAALPLILPSRPNATRMMVERSLGEFGRSPTIVAEIDGVPAILELVRGGFGHAILPVAAVRASGVEAEYVVTEISDATMRSKVDLVTPAKRPKSKAILEVAKKIADLAKKEISSAPQARKAINRNRR